MSNRTERRRQARDAGKGRVPQEAPEQPSILLRASLAQLAANSGVACETILDHAQDPDSLLRRFFELVHYGGDPEAESVWRMVDA